MKKEVQKNKIIPMLLFTLVFISIFVSMSNIVSASVVIDDPIPRSGKCRVSIYMDNISVVISEASGNFDYTIETDPDVGSITENAVADGVKTCTVSDLAYDTTYTWYVNATDGVTWTRTSYTFTTKSSTDFEIEDFFENLPEWGMEPYKVYVGDFVWMFVFFGVIAVSWGAGGHVSTTLMTILLIFVAYGTQRIFLDNPNVSLLLAVFCAVLLAVAILGIFLSEKRHRGV